MFLFPYNPNELVYNHKKRKRKVFAKEKSFAIIETVKTKNRDIRMKYRRYHL